MRRAGFRWILVGFESGHERILTNIRKRATRDDNTRCMAIARRHGLKIKALMSVGHPGESYDTVRASRDWLIDVRPDDFDATVITTTDHVTAVELTRLRDSLEADVRAALGIQYNAAAPSLRYDHSMGQGGIPRSILRRSAAVGADVAA